MWKVSLQIQYNILNKHQLIVPEFHSIKPDIHKHQCFFLNWYLYYDILSRQSKHGPLTCFVKFHSELSSWFQNHQHRPTSGLRGPSLLSLIINDTTLWPVAATLYVKIEQGSPLSRILIPGQGPGRCCQEIYPKLHF